MNFQDQKVQTIWPLFVGLVIIHCPTDALHVEITSAFHIFFVLIMCTMFCRSRVWTPDLTSWSFYWSQVWFPGSVACFRPLDSVAYVRHFESVQVVYGSFLFAVQPQKILSQEPLKSCHWMPLVKASSSPFQLFRAGLRHEQPITACQDHVPIMWVYFEQCLMWFSAVVLHTLVTNHTKVEAVAVAQSCIVKELIQKKVSCLLEHQQTPGSCGQVYSWWSWFFQCQ